VEKPEGKRPLLGPRSRWMDNIMMDLGEIRWCVIDWISVAQDRNQWWVLIAALTNLGSLKC
jgi:hypothetical protein